jgi:hypothetical protein
VANSTGQAVGDAAKAAVDALALTPAGGAALVSVKRKTPAAPEGVAGGLPQLVVSVSDDMPAERLTAAHKSHFVRFAVTIVTGGGRQQADDATVRQWRQQIDQAVYDRQLTAFAAVTGFVHLKAFGGRVFDPAALARDYNYSTLKYEAHVVESLQLT